MATSEFELAPTPADPRERELWMQHAAGFILFEDVRGYARNRLPATLSDAERAVAYAAIDDALYGLMQVAEGVSGRLASGDRSVVVSVGVRMLEDDRVVEQMDLADGDGPCMGYHGWVVGDFGKSPPAARR